MAVTRLCDKVYAEVAAILRSRCSDDDDILLEVSLVHDEDDACLGIYAALDCPETEAVARSYVLVPAARYSSVPEFVIDLANDMWDTLASFRIGHAEDLAGPTA